MSLILSNLPCFNFSFIMLLLSLSLAARQQQSKCRPLLRQHTTSTALLLSRTAASAALTKNGIAVPKNNDLNTSSIVRKSQLLNSSGQIVAKANFSVSYSLGSSGQDLDHVPMWTVEKIVSLFQIPCFIVPFLFTNEYTDAVFCTLVVFHSHWGTYWLLDPTRMDML